MLMRIVFSFIYISRWQKDKKLDDNDRVTILSILPDKIVFAVLVGIFSCGIASATYSPNLISHIAVGCVLVVCFVIAVRKKERKLISDLREMWSGKSN